MGRFLVPALGLGVLYYVWRYGWAGLSKALRPFLLLALALLYLRSPIDLLPDVGPVGFIDDLAVLLAALYFGWKPGSASPGSASSGRGQPHGGEADRESPTLDPFEVLGIARGATPEEITSAFRNKMKQYHPDRVADLGEELRKVAHEKSVEIQRAYEALKKN